MKHSISRRLRILIVFSSGFAGILPASQCSHGNCASCFGCAGIGILAVSMGLWKKFQSIRMHRKTVR